ncbi:MAG: helix-turn-helix transcriptional regulator [Candidatus Margulisbacteria bacterium]|nr:helix-turn-helix transcriptional regulator [Candidatus Margulisiibacteriota bacterium]
MGNSFHYVNIRLLPGVWQSSKNQTAHGMVDSPYTGALPLLNFNRKLGGLDFAAKQTVLAEMVEWLIGKKMVEPNKITEMIFANINDIHTVSDMARVVGLSPRQLQRTLKKTTQFAPHDFLKVLRLQQTLGGNDDGLSYADQSHFIRSFRKATGYTPGKYDETFDV